MSAAALLKSVRNWVRSNLDLDDQTCRIMPGPQPPPWCGERFLSIYPRDWRPGDPDLNRGIDEYFDVAIAVTYRISYSPYDEHGEEPMLEGLESLEAVLRKLLPIHQNIDIMQAANTLLPDADLTTVYPFIEPLRWQGCDAAPTYVSQQWFHADQEDGDDPYAGMVQEIRFGEARRKQPVSTTYTPR